MMSHKVPDKKRARTFSMTDGEFALLLERARRHGCRSRNEYLRVLIECESYYQFKPCLHPTTKARVLRAAA